MVQEGLHGPSIAVLHNHVDEVVVGVGLVKVDKIVGGDLPELEQDFPFHKGLVHFVHLGLESDTLMICFFDIFFMANWHRSFSTSSICPKEPFPITLTTL